MAEDLKDLSRQVKEKCQTQTNSSNSENNLSLNIVFRNVEEKQRENLVHEVYRIIKDGIGLADVQVGKAERKQGSNGKPGVIVAT